MTTSTDKIQERILLSTPDVGELEQQHVLDAMRSGWIAPLGPDVDAFENEMKERIGVGHAVALSSGTAALHLGLLTLGAGRGDVVVVSSMTFAATANAVIYTGATPFFVDADEQTGNMDPEMLREALSRLRREGASVKAVLPVDLLGKAVDYDAIQSVCDEFEVPMLSDAAESLGATYKGRPAGSFGVASAISFNGNKIMTTSGGGMLLTDDAERAARVRYLATQARQPVAHYEHTDVGYNYRLSNLLAALGRAQLSRLDAMMARRRQWRDEYRRLVADVEGVEVFGGEGDEADNVWLTSIVVDPDAAGYTAADVRAGFDAANIETRPLWKPMHLQPVFQDMPAVVNGASERLFQRGITLPSGSSLTDDQFTRVRDTLVEVLGGRR